jgi:hypothetical protein
MGAKASCYTKAHKLATSALPLHVPAPTCMSGYSRPSARCWSVVQAASAWAAATSMSSLTWVTQQGAGQEGLYWQPMAC